MWWEPTNEREIALADDVRRLQNWFVEQELPSAWGRPASGVGSIWSPSEGALVPFVLLNSDSILAIEFFPLFELIPVSEFPSFPLRLPETRLPTYAMALPHPRPTTSLFSYSSWQDQKERLLAELVQIREPIICTNSGNKGSAGIVVWDEAAREPALLTAGHTFPHGVGSGVNRLNLPLKRLLKFLPKVEHLGKVTHHVTPTGPSGWDAAIIQIETIKKPNASFVSQEYERFESPEKIWVHGAFTKFVSKAAVQGGLNVLRSDVMRWKRCWMVFPSGLLTDGDSGAAVFVEKDSSLLGMYVAQSEYRGSLLPLAHYVQDAFRLEQEVLRNWGISFRMGG